MKEVRAIIEVILDRSHPFRQLMTPWTPVNTTRSNLVSQHPGQQTSFEKFGGRKRLRVAV
jgi:hypothetical protein